MGVELHADVVRTAGYRPVCGGFSAVTIARAAASLLRGCACGLPAVIDVGPPWGPHIYMLPYRRFAFGSPAVIESSPPMGAQASRCVLRRGGPSARLFSRARSFARKYAKIGNTSFSSTSLRRPAVRAPQMQKNDAICHKSALIFLLKETLDGKFHPLDRRIDGMEMDFHGMDRWCRRRDTQKSPLEARKNL